MWIVDITEYECISQIKQIMCSTIDTNSRCTKLVTIKSLHRDRYHTGHRPERSHLRLSRQRKTKLIWMFRSVQWIYNSILSKRLVRVTAALLKLFICLCCEEISQAAKIKNNDVVSGIFKNGLAETNYELERDSCGWGFMSWGRCRHFNICDNVIMLHS